MEGSSSPWSGRLKEADTSHNRSSILTVLEIPASPQLPTSPIHLPPSDQEREYWYYGLGATAEARPHLIARSSREPFRYENCRFDRGRQSHTPVPAKKFISTIGAHPIVEVYDHGLRAQVLDILNGIKWQCVDVVRLGYSDELEGKPVILITADEDEVEQSDAQSVVDTIHALMASHGLSDVHAEVKNGRYFDARRYERGDIYPVAFNHTPLLGASIGNGASEVGVGSICLYLKIRNEFFALTCRHVAWPSDAPCPGGKNAPYVAIPGAEPVIITQPAKRDFDDTQKEKWKQVEKAEDPQKKAALETEKAVIDAFKSSMEFGTLYCTSDEGKDPIRGCHKDWALIRLSSNRFPTLPPNAFPPISGDFTVWEREVIEGQRETIDETMFPQSLTLPKMFTVSELTHLLKPTLSTSDDPQDLPTLRVLKHGRTSGWTAGSLNQLSSNCNRNEGDGGQQLVTTELCVVNLHSKTRPFNHFSYEGDSGACVIDLKGRVVGMLHGGNGKGQHYALEIAYVTPMEWVLEHIRERLGLEPGDITF